MILLYSRCFAARKENSVLFLSCVVFNAQRVSRVNFCNSSFKFLQLRSLVLFFSSHKAFPNANLFPLSNGLGDFKLF